jgi:uncharacterized protein (DUF1800 family)
MADRPYDEVVEDLLHPDRFAEPDEDVLRRYWPTLVNADTTHVWAARWIHRMINSPRQLEEKMALFWHHVFATAWFKSEHASSMAEHVQMLRENGLGNLRTLLLALSRDPAMIFWLDNSENHRTQPNENYGRELLELFSMGIGAYDETDVKMAGRAFTGWTFEQVPPIYPYGGYPTRFVYRPEDHDDSEKTFLGRSGRFNGEDIIDIICEEEATARFISRHLYNFFVADEPPVPAWSVTAPRDPEAIDALVKTFVESKADIQATMRTLLNSDFFKEARSRRIKCPVELVAGTARLSGDYPLPTIATIFMPIATSAMGQSLFDPPSVEGWHTGKEWIDGGTLTERVNFAVAEMAMTKPGPHALFARLSADGEPVPPHVFAEECFAFAGAFEPSAETGKVLRDLAEAGGPLEFGSEVDRQTSADRVGQMLRCIVSSNDYQFA